jgi:hypothetical protein
MGDPKDKAEQEKINAAVAGLFDRSGVAASEGEVLRSLSPVGNQLVLSLAREMNCADNGQPVQFADLVGALAAILGGVATAAGTQAREIGFTVRNGKALRDALHTANQGRADLTLATLAAVLAFIWTELTDEVERTNKEDDSE